MMNNNGNVEFITLYFIGTNYKRTVYTQQIRIHENSVLTFWVKIVRKLIIIQEINLGHQHSYDAQN